MLLSKVSQDTLWDWSEVGHGVPKQNLVYHRHSMHQDSAPHISKTSKGLPEKGKIKGFCEERGVLPFLEFPPPRYVWCLH